MTYWNRISVKFHLTIEFVSNDATKAHTELTEIAKYRNLSYLPKIIYHGASGYNDIKFENFNHNI